MKKNIFFTLIFTVLLAGWLGCNQNSPDETRTVDITFNSGDGYWEEGGEKVRTKGELRQEGSHEVLQLLPFQKKAIMSII